MDTTLVLLALKGGYAQSTVDSFRENTLPVIPTFDVKYNPSMVIVNAGAEVNTGILGITKEITLTIQP